MGISKERKWDITPKKRGQKSYPPVIAFAAETKEILHSWFRCGRAYTSNGIVEFMKECMAYMKKVVRVIFRGRQWFFLGRVAGLPGVGISRIPYQGFVVDRKSTRLNSSHQKIS